MGEKKFKLGDDVRVPGGLRGVIVDYRPLPVGIVALGIMDSNGRIEYHDERSVQSSEGMTGYPMKLV